MEQSADHVKYAVYIPRHRMRGASEMAKKRKAWIGWAEFDRGNLVAYSSDDIYLIWRRRKDAQPERTEDVRKVVIKEAK